MKVLVSIPCLTEAQVLGQAVESFKHPKVDFCLIDNGSEEDVKDFLKDKDFVIHNQQNMYVNYAWNQAMEYFLKGDWDILIIANSDVVMLLGWFEQLEKKFKTPKTVWNPTLKNIEKDYDGRNAVPGFCMCLTKEAVRRVYPIPEEIKVWFGDSWIFTILHSLGWKVMVLKDMRARHHTSRTIQRYPEILEIIEQDKIAWEKIVKTKLGRRINEFL